MNKKIFSSFLSLVMTLSVVGMSPLAYAAEDAKVLLKEICDSLNKDVNLGYQSNSSDPNNGVEIIAGEALLNLEPKNGTSLADLANAKFEANTSYTNVIVAQNTSKVVAGKQQLKVAFGFTQQSGKNNVPDLFRIVGIKQKAYKITIEDVKLYPKNGGEDIYIEPTPRNSYSVDPSSCTSTQGNTQAPAAQTGQKNIVIENFSFTPEDISIELGETVVWTNSDSLDHNVTSIGAGAINSGLLMPGQTYQKTFSESGTFQYECTLHPQMTGRIIVNAAASSTASTDNGSSSTSDTGSNSQGSISTETSIILTSDKAQANPGEDVIVTAIISNLQGSIDWSQSEGTRIEPNISNEAVSDTETKSTLSFTMPTPATNISLRLKVADTTESISIQGADNVTVNSAPDTSTTGTTTSPDNTGSSDTLSLQERLEQRRLEQEAAANPSAGVIQEPTGTLHAAAGGGLARSGPEHTLALLIASMFLAYLYSRKKNSAENI